MRLTSTEDWSEIWRGSSLRKLVFDPTAADWHERHELLRRHLPVGDKIRTLEIGAYPGRFLWYFHAYYGHQVAGVELVDWCAKEMVDLLGSVGISAEIFNVDLFDFELPEDELFDVVCSFGFVEHFEDSRVAIQRHVDLLKPGGKLVLLIPNHSGLNGKVMKHTRPDLYKMHNLMSYEDLAAAVESCEGMTVVEGGYYGKFNLWNTGLYQRARAKGRVAEWLVRGAMLPVERVGRLLAGGQMMSPGAALVATKA